MSETSINYHADTGDRFSVDVIGETQLYAVLKIRAKTGVPAITLFTPRGLNWTADYLREIRDVINGALVELLQMEKNLELKIDDEKYEAQDKEAGR